MLERTDKFNDAHITLFFPSWLTVMGIFVENDLIVYFESVYLLENL